MTRRLLSLATLTGFIVVTPWLAHAQQSAPAPARVITNMRGDLYHVRGDNNYNTVFLVTPAGIVMGDPISASLATWLKGELATRFPNRPVRYVIVSHHDADHASGAQIFNDTAEIVGHANFNAELAKARAALPDAFASQDKNKDGRLEREEVAGTMVARFVEANDRNGDGALTAAELNQDVIPVESSYQDRRTITLGGKTINLVHTGRWHAEDMTAVEFPAERVVFAVDYPEIKAAPPFLVPTVQDHIAGARVVEALDFDILVPGHGDSGNRADVTTYREYLQDLIAGVDAGIKAGQTLEQVQANLSLSKYAGWPNFAMRKNANIAAVYAQLRQGQPRGGR